MARPAQRLEVIGPGVRDQRVKKSTVVVVGQGYVGLPLAMGAVGAGFDVVGIDVDEWRVKRLDAGESFIEDISSAELGAALETGRYRASSDWADAADFDICVITVPTPLREGVPDLSYVEESGRSVAALLRPGATVVLESTTYPGTTDQILLPILEEGSGLVAGEDFFLGYSPERIDPGNQTWGLANTPKVVSGIDAGVARPGPGVLRSVRGEGRPGLQHPHRRDDEAAGEHLPPRQHRPGERDRHRSRPRSASTSGRPSTRPPASPSGSCASRPARASAGTACPSTPPTCCGRCGRPRAATSG